jgi:osmotically-inducible protein OsmY
LNTLRTFVTATALISLLSGCVLVVPNDDDSGHVHWNHDYSDSQSRDRDLAQAVRDSLNSDSLTHAAAISVRSHQGDITLQGTVDNADVLGRAVALAAGTPGVQKVICELVMLKNTSGK